MILKGITLTPPWNDQKAVQLEKLLVDIFGSSIQLRSGSYTGDGTDNRPLNLGLNASLIYIQRKVAGVGNAVFAIREAPGVSFVPGSGFIATAVKSFTPDGITIGTSTDINGSGVSYAYLAVG